ncbi:extracellular solute-binding protein [Endozoicomonas arenosclerae]|uniref:extracellular solute-binding protein n=1 Tax=Endozoicomonas arenosclerae TaxID=1633495 RepID=UPI0007813D82|nr:extracellular solute-binding protein [Endozoicomonas arenosclerae]
MLGKTFLLWTMLFALGSHKGWTQDTIRSHALSIHDAPKYTEGFSHFDYANPDAPKGGMLRKAATGTFDTFNTFAPKGNWADGSYFLYDTLMARAGDEPYSVYGLIAESIEYPKNFSWVIYHLNPDAEFHDGERIKPSDVVYTFNELQQNGPPHYRHLYSDVSSVTALNQYSVKFTFSSPPSKSLVLRLSQLRVLPAHFWQREENDLTQADLKPPLSSGPYKIKELEAGRYVTYERVKHYWAVNLPVNKGRHNFDLVRTDYYRDESVALEAFKQGSYDLRVDGNPKNWAQGYKGKALSQGEIIQEKIPNKTLGMRAYVFNLRKPLFNDRRVRKAISQAQDFNWINKHLFFGIYEQAYSLFSNSELAATGLPSEKEIKLLSPWKSELPEAVFNQAYEPVKTNGTGDWRANRVKALKLLLQAGWKLENGVLKEEKTGKPMVFEILLSQPEFERFVLPFANNLSMLGIKVKVTTIDTSQYINRLRKFDFDMVIHGFYPSIAPGTELKNFWGSASGKSHAGKNISGISLPVLDTLVEKAIAAQSRDELIMICRAIDRVVLWQYAVIPQWYLPYWPMIYRKGLAHPDKAPPYENGLSTWWKVAQEP